MKTYKIITTITRVDYYSLPDDIACSQQAQATKNGIECQLTEIGLDENYTVEQSYDLCDAVEFKHKDNKIERLANVSRSTYQKLAEQNKRLMKDIETLVMRDDIEKSKDVFRRWYKVFHQERELRKYLRESAIEYIKANKDRLPKFLTDKLPKE